MFHDQKRTVRRFRMSGHCQPMSYFPFIPELPVLFVLASLCAGCLRKDRFWDGAVVDVFMLSVLPDRRLPCYLPEELTRPA
jgi:hypothetical protein